MEAAEDPKLPVAPVGGLFVHAVKENECAGTSQAVELASKHPHPLMIVEGVQGPQVVVEGAVLMCQFPHPPGVFHCPHDLAPVPDDPRVVEQPGKVCPPVT